MNVTAQNRTNGATTSYEISFRSSIPMYHGDHFTMIFPADIKTPRFPVCEALTCLHEIKCTGESGRIVITFVKLGPNCGPPNSTFGIRIHDIKNPPSMVKSGNLYAYWTSEDYRMVANYTSIQGLQIQNNQIALLDPA